MNWTSEWPTEPGWYWMYDTLFSNEPEMVRVCLGVVYDTFQGEVYQSMMADKPYMFYGPIEPPAKQSASKSTQNA